MKTILRIIVTLVLIGIGMFVIGTLIETVVLGLATASVYGPGVLVPFIGAWGIEILAGVAVLCLFMTIRRKLKG